MAFPVEQFVARLTESGLMSGDEIDAFLSALPPDKKPVDGEQLARELVRLKVLTRFQAQSVYSGKAKSLVLGNYVLLDKIGEGGIGQVYKARHRRMDRVVALKVLSPAVTRDENIVRRFHQEVKVAAKLSHPNIVTAFDADEARGTHFLVMEFVEARDLSAIVEKEGPLSVGDAVHCIAQAAKGLEYAHKKGVVHRDIKPANLLLDAEGILKILDMGLARFDDASGAAQDSGSLNLTQTGQIMGTIDFMSPEQTINSKQADHRADIYSLGCTLYYLLGGKTMYGRGPALELFLAHREKPIPSLRALRKCIPEELTAVFEKMVAKKPEDRYQSMSDVIEDLEAIGRGEKAKSGLKPAVKVPVVEGRRSAQGQVATVVREQVKEEVDETGDYEAVRPTTAEVNPSEDNPVLERTGILPSRKWPLVGFLIAAGFLAILLVVAVLWFKT